MNNQEYKQLAHKISVNYAYTMEQIRPLAEIARGDETLVRDSLNAVASIATLPGWALHIARMYILNYLERMKMQDGVI